MAASSPDAVGRTPSDLRIGLTIAVLSAAAFASSGPLGRVLLDAGWSPGAAVAVRVLGGAVLLTIPALLALRGRWSLVRQSLRQILAYGAFAVAATQLFFFYAVGEIDVAVALLIEYAAPIAVVLWMWLRHAERPTGQTIAGAVIAAAGLVLILDLLSGSAQVNLAGVLWALGAMVGLACYFVMSADQRSALPPLVLVWAGLLVGGLLLVAAAVIGVLPWSWGTGRVAFAFGSAPWWVPVGGLMVMAAALAYWTGVIAARRLGSRLASFAGLIEAVLAVFYAWLLLHQLPATIQLVGGALILIGVVMAKAGERRIGAVDIEALGELRPDTEADEEH